MLLWKETRTPRPINSISRLLIGWMLCCVCPSLADADSPSFERDVAPILIKRCVECHRGETPSGGLNLSSNEGVSAGGDSGHAIDPSDLPQSHLLERVVAGEMPPEQKGQSQKLPKEEIRILQDWIAGGAKWPSQRTLGLFEKTNDVRAGLDWWSLQPIESPAIPAEVKRRNAIDFFVKGKLSAHSMTPAPKADKRTLLRRLYYDLIGLSPTKEQIESFEDDEAPDAWQKQVNLLLDSPHYGERWARYWLDLVRYADSSGYERDQEKPYAWRYRDWVVDAFNRDMPFADFVTQQIAGDEIEHRTEQSVVATGFLRLGTWNDEPNEPKDYVYDRLEDLVHTTSSTFLGLTVKCARCHTHKFDPIEQDDYYRFASVFWPGPVKPRTSDLLGGPNLIEIGFGNVLGWTDITPEPDPIHLLKNGERKHSLHEVTPATLSTIPSLYRELEPPPEGSKTTKRRLQLAQWITHPDNPLTSRVIVNRIWQHHFGEAIVRTPNNFGFLSDPPTHPRLLDWLASEFQSSGGSIKTIHRLILNSETWQQSSTHPNATAYEQHDASNRLLWRANRQRLDAESIRDAMLDATGELNRFMGGECFKATVSREALEGLSRLSDDWQASPEFMQKRRSIYMFMKRGLLPPMMTTFDLCDATQSCGQRNVTLVPTQALTLLNNQFVHDRAEHLANELIIKESDTNRRIERLWSAILRRSPTDDELQLARNHLRTQTKELERTKEDTSEKDESFFEALDAALCFRIRADEIKLDSGGETLLAAKDLSGNSHHAIQRAEAAQPTVIRSGIGNRQSIGFDGKTQYLEIAGELISEQEFTIIAVAKDTSEEHRHREIISNWNKDGNSTTSVFLGLTDQNTIRFSDSFPFAGNAKTEEPFLLVATSSLAQASVYQNGALASAMNAALTPRKMDTPWVIGKQGNHPNEYWKGEIAEIRVYDRALLMAERRHIEEELGEFYDIDLAPAPIMDEPESPDPEMLALASLCLVLLNSNEFMYVD